MTATVSEGVLKAARLMGSQVALAASLQVTPVTVSQWLRSPGARNARPVPPKQCVRIERVTQGAVTRRELRPDDWEEIWPEAAREDWRPVGATAEPAAAGGA